MYRRVELLIFEKAIPKKDIARMLGINYNTLLLKLSGKSKFTLDEAMMIKDILNSEKTIEYLFATDTKTA